MPLPPGFELEQPAASEGPKLPPGFQLESAPAASPVANARDFIAGNLNKGIAGLAGLPVDVTGQAVNLGIAGYGALKGALGGTPPDLINPATQIGGSQWIENLMRKGGVVTPASDPTSKAGQYAASALQMVPSAVVGKPTPAQLPGAIAGAAASGLGAQAGRDIGGEKYAMLGAMAPGLAAQAARALAPKPTPQTQLLADEGVDLTPGQKYGGGAKRIEDAATSIPVLGDAIKGAQRRGIESYNAAAINRALEPIGEELPKGLVGNKAIDYAYTKLGDAYDTLLPNLRGEFNDTLKSDLASITANAKETLPPAQRGQFNRIVKNEVINRFDQGGNISGQALKDIESKLGGMAKDFGRSENYDIRTLGEHVKDTQAALRDMVTEVNPKYEGELAKINDGYANFKIAQKAASSPAAPEGVFSPSQLHSAVRAKDTSKDKARFSEGAARMQDLSAAGKAVLPTTVPDSGTPYRAAIMYALSHPVKASILAPFVGAATLPYTKMGQGVLSGISGGMQPTPPLQGILQAILAEQQSANQRK